jgi:hypothetical protein
MDQIFEHAAERLEFGSPALFGGEGGGRGCVTIEIAIAFWTACEGSREGQVCQLMRSGDRGGENAVGECEHSGL